MKIDYRAWVEFWMTLTHLLTRKNVVKRTMDIPLDDGIVRSRYTSVWVILLSELAFLLACPKEIISLRSALPFHAISSQNAAVACLALLALPIASTIGYGFLRLYTLVAHVMTINVFKSRGQRLRLLNVLTTVLSLAFLVNFGWVLSTWNVLVARALIVVTLLYAIYLLSIGYNLIFHKQNVRGLLLFIGSSSVTWFVLFIGALGVLVALAMIWFFVLLILRIFHH